MSKIYFIVTHHEDPEGAGEKWVDEGVCAVGWFSGISMRGVKTKEQLIKRTHDKLGERRAINELLRFLQINVGDIIIAYQNKNTIAAIGKVSSDYIYNNKNSTGDHYGYPHQKKVSWLVSPRGFLKKHLPQDIAVQLGKRGITTKAIETSYSGDEFLKAVRSFKIPDHEGVYNEDLVKSGLSKYVRKKLDKLERGLLITREEKAIDTGNRPDFLAKDRNQTKVVIECKGSQVGLDAIEQVLRYKKSYGKNARYLLIAFSFDHRLIEKAKKNGIEVYEVDLKFKRRT